MPQTEIAMARPRCSSVSEAAKILGDLVQQQNGGDGNYFRSQLNRYLYSVERLTKLCPPPCRVLDIGSHYLHQAILLRLLGYEVHGIDVPLFSEVPFIRERAETMDIVNTATEAHQSGEFLQDCDGYFDLVICSEMLEHIAFNPVAFWRRVWHLVAPGGRLYVTTPNSFRVRALATAVKRLVTFEGLGLPVEEVLNTITYGHHWKEYSSREIRQYFQALSPDFEVRTSTYPDAESHRSFLARAVEIFPPLRTNIEAIVTVRGKTTFAAPPMLPMMVK